ncbi:Concanavalin A-like lectin/glucanase subgroup [Penicillium paradoxum]|uniref:Concanavalin A-like lectin/glucanase subgroup n=1 Tax=Penicillium paradoxum TaxID=176176 RepID=UPI002546D135|nr:Concanavalin A-like lectin/glucanase subgroup [Penicillium paradoxum]KAJ5795356.1 Concanavalin A-like lectin/glucanase subgroup [Penicillium paradoxum]
MFHSPMAAAHHNPIIPGFAPDPSICLIDDTFFLVNSSFHLYPGLPIYMSDDLIAWKHIGNAINKPGQLSLARATTFLAPWDDGTTMVGTGGLYAPTIRHHNGITYIICTNVIHGPSNELGDERNEQFIIHTTDIRSGNWSDPIIFEFPGIDPSLLFDDDRVYVQLCKTGPEFHIYNFEIDIETGTKITEPALIWEGWEKGYTEGPHVYKKDGWYYLLCAEGGTFRYHMLSMARSKSIWGPYEAYEMNPLYTASGTEQYVQNTGHGDLFQDQHDQWWVVMIGIRSKDGRCIMGRETFLTAVDWPSNGWPKIEPVIADGDLGADNLQHQEPLATASWVYLRDVKLDRYRIQDGLITVQADVADMTSPDESTSFVGQRVRRLEGAAIVTLYKPQSSTSVHAGLALYKDEHRFVTIGYDTQMKQVILRGLNQAKRFSSSTSEIVEVQDSLSFKISYTETALQFFFQANGQDWHELSTLDTAILTDYDFTGPVVGVFAIGNDVAVKFGSFQVDIV